MTLDDAIRLGWETLITTSASARLDAEILLAHVLEKDAAYLVAHGSDSLPFWKERRYRKLVEKRKGGMPVAYLTGKKEFYGMEFEVNPHVLIPRPDTEILVEEVERYVRTLVQKNPERPPILLDVGTGSGCIVAAILKEFPEMTAVAVDISHPALRVAARNFKRHGLFGRVRLVHSKLLEKVDSGFFSDAPLILTANLPYIPKNFRVDLSTRFEPDLALYGGDDGLELYRRLIEELERIKPQLLFFELFEFQAAILVLHLKHYRLIGVKKMTGQAQVMVLERVGL